MNTHGTSAAIYQSFEKKLSNVSKKELLYNLTKNLLYTFIFILAIGMVLIILESVFHFDTTVRKIFYWTFLPASVTTIVYFLSNYFLKRAGIIKPVDLITYSKKIGYSFEDIKDRLSNSMSLYKEYGEKGNRTIFSSQLIDADINDTNEKSNSVNFESVINFRNLRKPFFILLGIILFYIASFAIFPSELSGAVKRIVNYKFNYLPSGLGITFDITPGDAEISKGEKLDITISVAANEPGFKADEIEFYTKQITTDGVELLSDAKVLKPTDAGNFKTTVEDLNSSVYYFAEFKGVKSNEYKITVSDYPIVKSFVVSIYPPDFTGIPSKTLQENEGDIFCPEGSTVYFDIKSNKVLSYAGIVINNSSNVNFEVDGESARGSAVIKEAGTYRFLLKDEKGAENKNAQTYIIKVINDEAPKITIIEPSESNHVINGENELLVRARISDDYGFSKLVLGYRKLKSLAGNASAPSFTYENVPVKNLNATSLEVPYIWQISRAALRPGEKAEYFMEVTDNTGKTTRSDIRTIEYKSVAEEFRKNENMTKELKEDLKSVYDQAEEIQKNLEDLKKAAQRNEELGLNEDRKKQLESKLEDFQKNLNSTQNQIEQNMNDLQQKNMLNQQTLEQYMELQKMFNKVNTPELQKLLEKLREALKKNNQDELKDALKNFKFDEEAFKKYMEKAMELLKKIENMQKFGELTQKLDDIAKKQEDLKKETSENKDQNKMNELSEKQKDIKEQTKEFQDELKKLIDEINKMKEQMSAEDLENLQKQMQQKNLENKMQQSSDQLQQKQQQKSEKTQEQIMQNLNQMNEQMKAALESMMDSQDSQQKLLQKLKDIKKQLEEMSKRQQELRDKTDELNESEKQEFRQNQQQQSQLQNDLSQTIDDLMNTTKMGMQMTPELGKELGNAFNKMEEAGKELGGMKKDNASGKQGLAKQSLDNAAKMLGDMMGKMGESGKDGKGGKGNKPGQGNMSQLMDRLGEIIAQQMGLNGKMGKMGQNGKMGNNGKGSDPNNLSPEQRQEMQRLSLEQKQIQKSLEQLNEELRKEQEKTGEKVLGDMNQVQKEMQEIVKELEENRYDDKLIEKQNRILSRMLDAKLSQREKDFEPKRESRPGDNVIRSSPPEIVLQGPNSFNALKEDFLKLQKEGFTEDYEAIITKYLMELRKNGDSH